MKVVSTFLLFLLIASFTHSALAQEYGLRGEAANILETANDVILYSLDGDHVRDQSFERFYRYPVLGSIRLHGEKAHKATNAFKAAADHGGQEALCFNPRHALRIVANGHIFDYFLCYECGSGMVIEDSTAVIARFVAGGSPDALNGILTAFHVPLSGKAK